MNPRLLNSLICLALLALAVTALARALSTTPDERGFGTHEQLGWEPCGYLQAKGRPCISCGMTTSFAHMVRAEPIRSFRAQPAGALLCLMTIAAPAWLLRCLMRGCSPFEPLQRRPATWLLVSLVLLLAAWSYKIVVYEAAG